MLKSTRKDCSAPYPARPPLRFLVNQENSVLCVAKPTNIFFFIVVGFFHCKNIRSTQFTSVSASDLAIVHTHKHFGYQLLSQIAFFWTLSCIMCAPRSCNYNVYVRHVQPPLHAYAEHVDDVLSLHTYVYICTRTCIHTYIGTAICGTGFGSPN